jgi:hypothetical protein
MFKKTISYTDLEGHTVSEDFYFNLTAAEVLELETSVAGGLSVALQKILKEGDIRNILQAFKDIVKAAYGVKSDDGRRFVKNDKIWEEFTQTEAYSSLFMELLTDAEGSAKFVESLLPPELLAQSRKVESANPLLSAVKAKTSGDDFPTDAELESMSTEQLLSLELNLEAEAKPAPEPEVPAWIREEREPTKAEMRTMTQAQLVEVMKLRLAKKRAQQ